jgi:hypothetical protein
MRGIRQDWNHRHRDPTRNLYVQLIQGLAPLKRANSNLYERVDFLNFTARSLKRKSPISLSQPDSVTSGSRDQDDIAILKECM